MTHFWKGLFTERWVEISFFMINIQNLIGGKNIMLNIDLNFFYVLIDFSLLKMDYFWVLLTKIYINLQNILSVFN